MKGCPERALIIYSRRVPGARGLLVETLGSLIGALPSIDSRPPRWPGSIFTGLNRNSYESLSYVTDWLEAFRKSPILNPLCVNISNLLEWPRARKAIEEFPLIIILHSAAGDNLDVVSKFASLLQNRRGKILQFFGNEYSLMPQKIGFAKKIQADFVASQLPLISANWLYAECKSARILHAPSALNPSRYYPIEKNQGIDIGFRGDLYPFFIGDDERTRILQFFSANADVYRLLVDIRYRRVAGGHWHEFLTACKGIVGAEAGTYFLERDDSLINDVLKFQQANRDVTFEDIYREFFACRPKLISGKAISSRHFEAVGAQTCQLLIEGLYNGVLKPNVHYLSVRKDLSNVEEVIRRFKDREERTKITKQAYEHVIENHTYDKRVADILATVLA